MCFALIIVLFCLPMIPIVSTNASDVNTIFSAQSVRYEEQTKILGNLNFSVLEEEPTQKAFDCFDVQDDGRIAIGMSNGQNKIICIYDSTEFQYGYSFESSGSFGVEWDADCINICLVRSDLIVSIAPEGKIKEVLEIEDTIDNSKHWRNTVFSTKKTVGSNQYEAKNQLGIFNLFASSYSQLIVTDATGSETIIYDATNTQLVKSIIVFTSIIIFISIVLYVIIKKWRSKLL